MTRRPVRSSNISSVGWEPEEENSDSGTLEVEFRDGRLYQYSGVPLREYEALIGAGSVGRYLAAYIIGAYDESRVG